MLSIERVNVHYGGIQALFDISARVEEGTIVALLGRNGAGKTTLLKSCVGLLRVSSGHIAFQGCDITNMETHRICSLGVGYVFQERSVFPELTVLEHLTLATMKNSHGKRTDQALDETIELFPDLEKRVKARAGTLSGGEAQMLEIGMALVREPRLLLLDEPSQGLSSVNLRRLVNRLLELKRATTILLSEQNIQVATEMGDRVVVIRDGSIVYEGTREDVSKGGDQIAKKYIIG